MLTRRPYQKPQTPMERHVEALADTFGNDSLTRGEFYRLVFWFDN